MGVSVGSRLVWRATAPLLGAAFLVGVTVALTSGPAQARKQYSEETGFPCKKCHNDPAGGKDEGWTAYGLKYKAKIGK